MLSAVVHKCSQDLDGIQEDIAIKSWPSVVRNILTAPEKMKKIVLVHERSDVYIPRLRGRKPIRQNYHSLVQNPKQ